MVNSVGVSNLVTGTIHANAGVTLPVTESVALFPPTASVIHCHSSEVLSSPVGGGSKGGVRPSQRRLQGPLNSK